ncbi:hypothetical protein F511_29335 [Dorcoceras hygrometricum]|uniref:Uncharacterized protein n=1 Tax=Dorcoceras hygrometricum TaxID=472368 RepID=A0A2Z7DCQ7_9LAMI|nr:hypothetical protein F511_29335 [Dorcoceras hygrometricum]
MGLVVTNMVSEHGPEINTRTPRWNRFHRLSLRRSYPGFSAGRGDDSAGGSPRGE